MLNSAVAASMSGALSAGVGVVSTEMVHYSVHQVSSAQKQESRRTERGHIREEIMRANRRARHLTRIFQNEDVSLSRMSDGTVVDPEVYQGMVDALRGQEFTLKSIIDMIGREAAEGMGIMELRKHTAEARSAASGATLLAKQTTNRPQVIEGASSGEAMKALADRFENELTNRFS